MKEIHKKLQSNDHNRNYDILTNYNRIFFWKELIQEIFLPSISFFCLFLRQTFLFIPNSSYSFNLFITNPNSLSLFISNHHYIFSHFPYERKKVESCDVIYDPRLKLLDETYQPRTRAISKNKCV